MTFNRNTVTESGRAWRGCTSDSSCTTIGRVRELCVMPMAPSTQAAGRKIKCELWASSSLPSLLGVQCHSSLGLPFHQRHGIGTYEAGTSKSRIRKYEGEVPERIDPPQANKLSLMGIDVVMVGSVQWAFGKKNGKGHIWFTNGNQYEGTFKRDQVLFRRVGAHCNGPLMRIVMETCRFMVMEQ